MDVTWCPYFTWPLQPTGSWEDFDAVAASIGQGQTPLCRRRRLQTPLWQLSRNAFKVCKHKNKTFCDDRLRRMNVLPQTLEIDSSIVGYCMCYMWFRIVPLHAGNVHAAVVSGARAARDILDKQASSTWPPLQKRLLASGSSFLDHSSLSRNDMALWLRWNPAVKRQDFVDLCTESPEMPRPFRLFLVLGTPCRRSYRSPMYQYSNICQ